jgi:hypothetical protein
MPNTHLDVIIASRLKELNTLFCEGARHAYQSLTAKTIRHASWATASYFS